MSSLVVQTRRQFLFEMKYSVNWIQGISGTCSYFKRKPPQFHPRKAKLRDCSPDDGLPKNRQAGYKFLVLFLNALFPTRLIFIVSPKKLK